MTSSSPISFDSSEQTHDDSIGGAPGTLACCDEEGDVSNGFNNFVDTYLSVCANGNDAANEEVQHQNEGKDKKEGEVVTIEVNYSHASGGMAKEFADAALATLKIPVLCPFSDPANASPRNRSETIVEEDKGATKSASEVFEDSMNDMVCQCQHSLAKTPSQWRGTETLPEPTSRKLRNLAVGSLRRLFQHQPPADSAAAQGGSKFGNENTTLSRRKISGHTPEGIPGGNSTNANANTVDTEHTKAQEQEQEPVSSSFTAPLAHTTYSCPRCRLPNSAAATRLVANASEDSTKLKTSRSLPATLSATSAAMNGPDIIGISNQPPLPARTGLNMAKNVGAPTMDDQLDARYKHLEEGTKLKAVRAMNGQIEYVDENDMPVSAEHIARLQDEARYEKIKLMGLPMTAAQIAVASSQRVSRYDPSIVVESRNDLQVTSLPSSSDRIRNFLFGGRQQARNGPTLPSMPPNHDPSAITLEATLVKDAPEIPLYDAVQVQDEVTHTRWRKYRLCMAGVGFGLLLGIGLAAAVGVPLMSNSKNDASISALTTSETSPMDPALLTPGPPSHSSNTTGSSFPSETHHPSLPSGSSSYSQSTEWSSGDGEQEGEGIYVDPSNDSQLVTLHLGQH